MAIQSIQSVCVYCGSADGVRQVFLDAAYLMGQTLAQAGIKLVYGAGKTGLMGAVAEGALQAGGEVVGVVPVILNTSKLIHANLTHLEVVDNMHLRKARMSELADALIALPGGYGTFEELFEQLTWAQIGLHHKPIGLLNTGGYYDPLLALVKHALTEGFIYAEHHVLLASADDPTGLLSLLKSFEQPSGLERWLNRE
jgi:uncharacterized protein (TIGR00730 family)